MAKFSDDAATDTERDPDATPVSTSSAAAEWLASPVGQALLAREARLLEEALDGVFGEDCLQLGVWGEPRSFLKLARTQRAACVAQVPVDAGEPPSAVGRLHRLPIASDSIDVVIMPHTLDFSAHQHEILREVHRVLRSDGHLVVLGFKPGGFWGLRRVVPGAGLPPGLSHPIGDRRLSDWLKLLDINIQGVVPYFFKWPLTGTGARVSPAWEERGRRWWPEFSACYMLTAQKRMYTMTPVRQPWRRRPKVVGGLVEPTTRVSRIRIDD